MTEPERTPLQDAALEKIRFFTEALAERGLKVRLSIEQKFLTQDEPDLYETNIIHALRKTYPTYLLPRLQSGHKAQLTFGCDEECNHTPEEVVRDVAHFRKHGHNIVSSGKPLYFKPYSPDIESDEMLEDYGGQPYAMTHALTLGMHINTSVYDEEGNDICDIAGFMRMLSDRMLIMEEQAGLGYIQTENNLQRLGSWGMIPRRIGLGKEKQECLSLVEKNGVPGRYLENRLSGADGDPYVLVALELAAIYDAIAQHPVLKHKTQITYLDAFKIYGMVEQPIDHSRDFDIGKDMKKWVARFEDAGGKGLKDLLGEPLYAGILKKYGEIGCSL